MKRLSRGSFSQAVLCLVALAASAHAPQASAQARPTTELALSDPVCVGLALGAQPVPPAIVCRAITKLTGDLYRVQYNRHHTIFLVTPDGVILADPISVEAATWLKDQIAQRFRVPVRYVLHSHAHWDHASGARVFDDTAEVWGHANMARVIQAETQANADLMKDVRPPEKTYTNRQTITLGGKRVEMVHPGPNHSIDATVLLFPAERVVYVVDFISIRRAFASALNPADPPPSDWINSFKAVEALDFDLVAPGHGNVGTKADVVVYRKYFEELIDGVSEGIRAGRTVEQLQASDMLEQYSWLSEYATRRNGNIAEAYKVIQAARIR